MATEWIRVRDTRTGDILPNPVPVAFLDKFDYLKEVPSSRRVADRVRLEEPVQPGGAVPITGDLTVTGGAVPITGNLTVTGQTTITEPGKPGKKAGGTHA